MKASAICVNSQWRDVYKDPVTDIGKVSKRGRLALAKYEEYDGFYYVTVRESMVTSYYKQLETVYENGKILVNTTFAEVRERAAQKVKFSRRFGTFTK